MKSYRPDLPPMPERIKALPVDRGFPVPWFVPLVDGRFEFRMAEAEKLHDAIKNKRCWVCGQRLDRFFAFVIGPMCGINKVTAEPPCHQECAEFSAVACPFLTGKQPDRREGGLPEPAPEVGMMIRRNPGCTLVWTTATYELMRVPNGVLFRIGNPSAVKWFAHGRKATREEVVHSIDTGFPILLAEAERDGPDAVRLLHKMRDEAERLLPKGGAA